MNKSSFLIPLLCFELVACAPDIGGGTDDSGDTGWIGDQVTNIDNEDGTTTSTVDASDYEVWIYLDFESGQQVTVEEPETDPSWDIAFQRYHPKINGGVSGDGEMEVAILGGEDFDALDMAPSGDYDTDEADQDDDGIPQYAMDTWYDYDPSTHVLSPADQVYVLRTVEGNYVKLRFDHYYDDAGTSGFPQFTWGFVSEPSGDGGDDGGDDEEPTTEDDSVVSCSESAGLVTTVADSSGYTTVLDSAASGAWTCLSFSSGEQVGSEWSFAWQQWTAALPEGTSGVVLDGEDYDSLDVAPSEGWSWSNMSLFSDWYDYDPSTHILTPKDRVYVLMDPEGAAWKLRIESYYDENDTLHHPTFRWAPISVSE